ncbi:MAG: AAA family ATPase [Bacteroidota bacterium]
MNYTKFTIKNYKGIKELTIDLEKEPKSKVLTLVGLNESGKTSILEAINLFQGYSAEEKYQKEYHKLIPKDKKLNFNDSVNIEAHILLDAADEEAIQKHAKTLGILTLNPISTFKIERKISFKNSVIIPSTYIGYWDISIIGTKTINGVITAFNGSKTGEWKKIVNFIRENLLPRIIYYPNFLFDFPSKIYLEQYLGETEEQATYREVLGDILDSMGGGLNIPEHLVERMKSDSEGASEALDSTLNKMSSIVSKTVFQAWQTLFQSKGKEIVIKPGKELGKEQGDTTKYYLEIRLKEGANQFQINERSLGFKWFFTFLLFTEFRKMRSTDKGEILFLLDEPASNLHSTAQKKLLQTFEKLVTKCKLIYTTHSHHLINPDWLAGVYIIKNKNLDYEDEINFDSEKTDIEAIPYSRFASQFPEQRTYFQPILDSLDFQPGLLEEIEDIIITEGKSDYYTLKYINEVILDNKYKGLRLYPGTGCDRNEQVIALYLAWNRNFKIILDGDKAGIDAKKRYVSRFAEVQDRIYTYVDIDEEFNYSTEFMFTEDERLTLTKAFDKKATSFDKSKFNTSIQTLFIQKKKISISKETLDKFEKVFSKLK